MKLGLKSKLLTILLTSNILVAGTLYWVSSKSFDERFLDFIATLEVEKLKPLTQEMVIKYKERGSLEWVVDERPIWISMIAYHVLKSNITTRRNPPPRPPPSFDDFGSDRPKPKDFNKPKKKPPFPDKRRQRFVPAVSRLDEDDLNFDSRLIVKDKAGFILIGKEPLDEKVYWIDIESDGEIIGQLGAVYKQNLTSNLGKYFIAQQKEVLATIVIIMLFVAVIVALLLAQNLLHHINLLKKGLKNLVKGQYEENMLMSSNDELGQLALDINFLSRTLLSNQHSRQRWIADISHELRTPVAILKGELEAIMDGVRPADEYALKSLHQETDRLALLINDLHELSLSDLGALSYQKESLDFVDLLQDFIFDHQFRVKKEGIEITFESNVSDYIVYVDASRIEQCFKNLLQNSLRYTDSPGQIKISLTASKTAIEMLWEDSSPGVEAKDLEYLFDRLYRVEKSRNRAKGGAGLGLSICKNILDAHDIDVLLFQSPLGGLGIKMIVLNGQNYE